MNSGAEPIILLMAEDDPDDRLLVREAMEEGHLLNELYFVEDGVQLLDYLKHQGDYANPEQAPFPDLILLDLNMPRKDGREALQEIKTDPKLRRIPVIVLTTSKAEEDIFRTYDLGVAGYITKPVTFDGLIEVMKTIAQYWFQIVKLPPKIIE